jgi:predicted nucleic acid-binding protein
MLGCNHPARTSETGSHDWERTTLRLKGQGPAAQITEQSRARHYVLVLQHVVTMVEADTAQALGAAQMKHKYKLGYADSFAAMLALTLKATLVSADPAFERLGKTLKWVRLPKFGSPTHS